MWPAIAIGTTVIGGVVAAYGQRSQAADLSGYYKYMASATDVQAQLTKRTAEQNVRLTQMTAAEESKRLARSTAELEGTQKATLAAKGIGGGSVTAADIVSDTLKKYALDEAAIRYGADVKSWEYQTEAANKVWSLGVTKEQYLMAAKQAKRAGKINVLSTLLGTAGTVASQWGKL